MARKRNDIEVEDITGTSQYDGQQVLKDVHSLPGHYLRVRESLSVVPEYFDQYDVTYNANNLPSVVRYYKGTQAHISTIAFNADVSGSLNNKYFFLSDADLGRDYLLYFSVDGNGVDPDIPGRTSLEIPISLNDLPQIVAASTKLVLENASPDTLDIIIQNSVLTIKNTKLGEVLNTTDINTGFIISNSSGQRQLIREIYLTYDSQNNPIYDGETFVGHKFNIFSGKFEKGLSDTQDYVGIGDGEDRLEVNPDGSINVNIVQGDLEAQLVPTYNEVNSVASETLTTIVTYTAPIGKLSFLQKIDTSGENVATYTVEINGTVEDKGRTYFGGNLDKNFEFSSNGSRGFLLQEGDVVTVKVIHSRPMVSDFNAKIQVLEI